MPRTHSPRDPRSFRVPLGSGSQEAGHPEGTAARVACVGALQVRVLDSCWFVVPLKSVPNAQYILFYLQKGVSLLDVSRPSKALCREYTSRAAGRAEAEGGGAEPLTSGQCAFCNHIREPSGIVLVVEPHGSIRDV